MAIAFDEPGALDCRSATTSLLMIALMVALNGCVRVGYSVAEQTDQTVDHASSEQPETDLGVDGDLDARLLPGDLDNDGDVDCDDFAIFKQDWGRTDCNSPAVTCKCDLDADGNCDGSDYYLFGKDWGYGLDGGLDAGGCVLGIDGDLGVGDARVLLGDLR